MAALPKKLQVQSFCAYQSQHLMPLYKYQKFELQAGLLGQKAF